MIELPILIHLGLVNVKPTPKIIEAMKAQADAAEKLVECIERMSDEQFASAWNSLFKPKHQIDAEMFYKSLYE